MGNKKGVSPKNILSGDGKVNERIICASFNQMRIDFIGCSDGHEIELIFTHWKDNKEFKMFLCDNSMMRLFDALSYLYGDKKFTDENLLN